MGQKVSVNLLDTSMAMMANFITPYLKSLVPVRPVGGGHPQMVPYQTFLAGDGKWLMVACLTEQFWNHLCTAIGRNDLPADPRFSTNVERVANRAALGEALDPIFLQRTSCDWEDILIRHDVPVAKVNVLEEVLQDPQVVYNKMVTTVCHPICGNVPVANNPIRMSASGREVNRYAPGIGEHTDEILRSLGISGVELDALKSAGVIRQA